MSSASVKASMTCPIWSPGSRATMASLVPGCRKFSISWVRNERASQSSFDDVGMTCRAWRAAATTEPTRAVPPPSPSRARRSMAKHKGRSSKAKPVPINSSKVIPSTRNVLSHVVRNSWKYPLSALPPTKDAKRATRDTSRTLAAATTSSLPLRCTILLSVTGPVSLRQMAIASKT